MRPIYLILALLILILPFTINAAVPQAERDALVALYDSTDGDHWTNHSNWLVGDPCDNSWYGIVCGTNKIVEIRLSYNRLTGSIPAQLANLSNLETLDLESNHYLAGNIPPELGNLNNLQKLYLSDTQLTGSIPTELGSLVNLKELYLEWTNLGGSIPSQFGNLVSLEIFSAYYSQLTGSIPPQLGNLSK